MYEHIKEQNLSIVIPFHSKDLSNISNLQDLIKSFARVPVPTEIILVCNNFTSKYQKEKIEDLRIYHNDINIFYYTSPKIIGVARNIGFSKAKYSYTLFVDSDVDILPSSFKYLPNLLKKMEFKNIAAVHPENIIYAEGNVWSYLDCKEDIRSYRQRKEGNYIKILFGPCIIINSNTFKEIGKFEDRVLCAEDRDLAMRLIDEGHKISFETSFTVCHHNPATLKRIIKRKIFHAKVNGIIYLRYPRYYKKDIYDWFKMYVNILDIEHPLASMIYMLILIFYTFYFYQFFYRLKIAKRLLQFSNALSRKLALFLVGNDENYIKAIEAPPLCEVKIKQ